VTRGAPIGVFDSGFGGLSVLREIRSLLPTEDLLYVADSGFAPYGERDEGFIRGRTSTIADFFSEQGVKAVVVACNTATAVAVDELRATRSFPVVAIEPGIKPAVAATRSGVVGVLATRQTLASTRFEQLVERHGGAVKVLSQPCPGWVERVEAGDLEGPQVRSLVEDFVAPLLRQGADTLVLGCTHYTFLAPVIRMVAPDAAIVDPAPAVARQLRRRLEEAAMLASGEGAARFWTSGDPTRVAPLLASLWGGQAPVAKLPQGGG
jgi:glutamate racemase